MPEAVIIDAIRTPIGDLGGALAAIRPDDLAALVIKAIVERNQLDPHLIEEVYLGCANQAGEDNRNIARMAALLAGLPVSVPGVDDALLDPRRTWADPAAYDAQAARLLGMFQKNFAQYEPHVGQDVRDAALSAA